MSYTRFALYALPQEPGLAACGARWLGWDVQSGQAVAQPDLPGLREVTQTARKYGFHGTLKPPFRLAPGQSPEALARAVSALSADLAPVACGALEVSAARGFVALRLRDAAPDLARLAARLVAELDGFRAPPAPGELERRRKAGLSARQEALLQRWGYPYVMEEFHFHLTLTHGLSAPHRRAWCDAAAAHFAPLPRLFELRDVALVGERADGHFELIHRYALSG